jgi:hypothetical protein
MKSFEKSKGRGKGKGKGKAFAPFAPFAPFAHFQCPLLAAAMVIAALFFASCGSSDDSDNLLNDLNPAPAEPTVSIKPDSPNILPGGQTGFSIKVAAKSMNPALMGLKVTGGNSEDTRIDEGVLYAGDDEETCILTITSTAYKSITATVKVIDASGSQEAGSIKDKFGITETGTAGVKKAFQELSAFIKKGGLTNNPGMIKFGDWLDLEGGLSVAKYGAGTDAEAGGFTHSAQAATTPVDPSNPAQGTLCRLIVVGVNSFQSRDGYTYQGGGTPPAHVVFQFQNIPVKRRMNPTDTNDGGYGNSEMRKYLTPVGGDPATGNFFKGLLAAGVPDSVVWMPARAVANGDNTVEIIDSDKLWLPSVLNVYDEREYHGWGPLFIIDKYPETTENQAWFEYGFDWPSTRVKWNKESAGSYWLSTRGDDDWGVQFSTSPSNPSDMTSIFFCASPSSKQGVAPTFCVY